MCHKGSSYFLYSFLRVPCGLLGLGLFCRLQLKVWHELRKPNFRKVWQLAVKSKIIARNKHYCQKALRVKGEKEATDITYL